MLPYAYIVEDELYARNHAREAGVDRNFETIVACQLFLNIFPNWWTYKDQHELIHYCYGNVDPENMSLGAWRLAAMLKWLDIGKRPLWFPEAWGNPWSIRVITELATQTKVDVYTASPQVLNFYPVSNVKLIRNGEIHIPPDGLEEWEKKFPTGELWTMGNLYNEL